MELSKLFRDGRKTRNLHTLGSLSLITEAVDSVSANLRELKAAQAPALATVRARNALFLIIDCIQTVLEGLSKSVVCRSWVEEPPRDPRASALHRLRRSHARLFRLMQLVLISATIVLVIFVLPISSVTVLVAAFIAVCVLLEFTVLGHASQLSAAEWVAERLSHRLPSPIHRFLVRRKRLTAPIVPIARAELLVDEAALVSSITQALDIVSPSIEQADTEQSSPPVAGPNPELLNFLQILAGRMGETDQYNVGEIVEALLPNVLNALAIEVIEWHADQDSRLWEVRLSSTLKDVTMRLPALRARDHVILRGLVYKPMGGNGRDNP